MDGLSGGPAFPGGLARPILNVGDHAALWVSERLSRVSTVHLGGQAVRVAAGRAGLDPALSLHCLRHSYVTQLIVRRVALHATSESIRRIA